MKVVIIGGYGVFGSLTARLLVRDGHQVILAGRNPKQGQALAQEIGADLLKIDMRAEPEAVFDLTPDVVVDAAGPYQLYGADPYRLPRLCIAHGCHYLDLSDSTAFTLGLGALSEQAEAAGVFVLSGASSVPGLSSIIVTDLSRGMAAVERIDIAILPGNRAPRGLSVIKSVLSGVGRPFRSLRYGQWTTVRGWTDRTTYELEPGMRRAGYLVDVPDVELLPEMTGAKTVVFRAGLELPLMNGALAALAWARGLWDFDLPGAANAALHALSKLLYPFGSDRGGMQVAVTGRGRRGAITRTWTLIAEAGDGPFIPGIVCRAILREAESMPAGARPALATVSRAAAEAAMADLEIRFDLRERTEHATEVPDRAA